MKVEGERRVTDVRGLKKSLVVVDGKKCSAAALTKAPVNRDESERI
jgi:hypothetical protein